MIIIINKGLGKFNYYLFNQGSLFQVEINKEVECLMSRKSQDFDSELAAWSKLMELQKDPLNKVLSNHFGHSIRVDINQFNHNVRLDKYEGSKYCLSIEYRKAYQWLKLFEGSLYECIEYIENILIRGEV